MMVDDEALCVHLPVSRLGQLHGLVVLVPATVSLESEVTVLVAEAVVFVVDRILDRTHGVDTVGVANFLEIVDLVLVLKERDGDRMHRRISPSFVEEPALLVEEVEVGLVGLASPEVHVGNLKIGPEMAQVVGVAVVVGNKVHKVVLVQVLGVQFDELLGGLPQGLDGSVELVNGNGEPVKLVFRGQCLERVVFHIAPEIYMGLHPPVVLVVKHERVLEKEAGIESAHVSIRLAVGVDDAICGHSVSFLFGEILVDEVRIRPMFFRDETELRLATDGPAYTVFELLSKRLVVQENPVVVEIPVETVLQVPDRLQGVLQVLVTTQRQHCRVLSRIRLGQFDALFVPVKMVCNGCNGCSSSCS